MTTKLLPCSCCPRPFAQLVRLHNGEPALVVMTRHKAGEKHANVLTLEQVKQMLAEFEAQEATVTRQP